jgi:catechol 2,3-dioxygenase-like lactoylglutathione lyase family enzyme
MLDHFGLKCRTPEVTVPFYEACLAPLGIRVIQRQPEFRAVIFKREGSPLFMWVGYGGPDWAAQAGRAPLHFGFRADSTEAVDAFHATGMELGAKDNGPPGYRRPTCYSAFLFDPEGNNIEAIWQSEREFPGR